LDVQPAEKSDGWDTEPFELIEKDGKLYGRGSTDDKGPILAWINAVEACQKTGVEIPVNIKFVFEGLEEHGSAGLDEALERRKDTWLKDVDYVVISDNYYLGLEKPCLTYGLRGLSYFFVDITCAAQDLHSGIFGGSVHEAMSDLIYLLDRLVDKDGKILVPGVYDKVAPLKDEERALYDNIDFEPDNFRKMIGAKKLIHEKKHDVLMSRWRYPSLSIHGIENAFSGPGSKTVIPRNVIGKFSIRLVPNQDPKEIDRLVKDYLEKLHKERGSPNTCKVEPHHSGKPWMSDFKHPHFDAGRKAIKMVYGCEPDLIREGGSIPVTLSLQDYTQKNVMLLPLGACDDSAHSQNEKMNRKNYIEGTKVLAAYLFEVANLKGN